MARGQLETIVPAAALAMGCAEGASPQGDDSGLPTGFECVGDVSSPDAAAPSFEASMRFYEVDPQWDPRLPADEYLLPLDGLKVEVCESRTDCSTPYATVVTGARGDATMMLPTPGKGFRGSLRLSAAGFITHPVTFDPPIVDANNPWLSPAFHTQAVYTPATFRTRWGAVYDPSRASIVANVVD